MMNIKKKLRRFKVILTPLSKRGVSCSFEIKYKKVFLTREHFERHLIMHIKRIKL